MIVLFKNGGSAWVQAGRCWEIEGKLFVVTGMRGRELAHFALAEVCGWFYDNEEVTTYGFAAAAEDRR